MSAAERCDGANLAGLTCVDGGFTGGALACAADCRTFITTGCTGAGPTCGDAAITGFEVCDSGNLGGESCVTQGFSGGPLACSTDCMAFDTTECLPAPRCGDGLIAGSEVCDGTKLGGKTCATLRMGSGTLSCGAGCTSFNTSGCTGEGAEYTSLSVAGSDWCEQFSGMMTDFDVAMYAFYGSLAGYYSGAACPTANRVAGYCDLAGTFAPKGFYYSPTYDYVSAATDCGLANWIGTPGTCGDGTVSGAEVCDGANLAGQTCATIGEGTGTLTCAGGCMSFNVAGCTGGSGAGSLRTVSCANWDGNDYCEQWTGLMTSGDVARYQASCDDPTQGSTFAATPCPTANTLAGHCVLSSSPYTHWFVFDAAAWTPLMAESQCSAYGGSWN